MELSKIQAYRQIRKTIYEMLSDRKYQITQPNNLNETDETLVSRFDMKKSKIVGVNDNNEEICVLFVFDKIGIKEGQDIISYLIEEEIEHVIVVASEYTPQGSKLFKKGSYDIDNEYEMDIEIEMFTMERLLYNITKHQYQPKKIELIKDKKIINEVYKTFKISKAKNINIALSDPINKYYNGKSGDMYKVLFKGGRLEYVTVL